jgi:hypothetical protein
MTASGEGPRSGLIFALGESLGEEYPARNHEGDTASRKKHDASRVGMLVHADEEHDRQGEASGATDETHHADKP